MSTNQKTENIILIWHGLTQQSVHEVANVSNAAVQNLDFGSTNSTHRRRRGGSGAGKECEGARPVPHPLPRAGPQRELTFPAMNKIVI